MRTASPTLATERAAPPPTPVVTATSRTPTYTTASAHSSAVSTTSPVVHVRAAASLPRATNVAHKLVGRGSYGNVFRVIDRRGIAHAVKVYHSADVCTDCVRELLLLSRLSHPNVVSLRHAILHATSGHLCLVLEYLQHDLARHARTSHIGERSRWLITLQVADGLAYLASHAVMHRDLKPSNILIGEGERAVIADFGAARCGMPGRRYTLDRCTLWYRAPEVLLGMDDYGLAVDAWSLGCIYFELLTGAPVFAHRGDAPRAQLRCIAAKLGVRSVVAWPELVGRRSDDLFTQATANPPAPLVDDCGMLGLLALSPTVRMHPIEAAARLRRALGSPPLAPPRTHEHAGESARESKRSCVEQPGPCPHLPDVCALLDDVSSALDLRHSTAVVALALLERHVLTPSAGRHVARWRILLDTLACIAIATKFAETCPPDTSVLVPWLVTAEASLEQLLAREQYLLCRAAPTSSGLPPEALDDILVDYS